MHDDLPAVPYRLRETIPQVGLLSLFPGIYLRRVR